MNKVILIGRLTRDPDLRFIASSGTAVTTITLAVDRSFKKDGQPEADFIRCVCYGKRAETIANYFSKGRLIAVSGRIETGSYDKDNVKVYTTNVIIEDFQFIESKGAGTTSGGRDSGFDKNNEGVSGNTDEPAYMDDVTPVDDGDIPF
jgi:single-strand DNA-binding protein